jgi:hypothetical protein
MIMAKAEFSTEKDSRYKLIRNKKKWSREDAAERLNGMSADRLERIENWKIEPDSSEVVLMEEVYQDPLMWNYYCTTRCEIGKKHIPVIHEKELSQITLEVLSSLNTIHQSQQRLIQITVDGKIDENELNDFIAIKKELKKISEATKSLETWVESKINAKEIDKEVYLKAENTI